MNLEQIKKINWRQPKYILPAIIYFPLLFTGYFIIDMFQTEISSLPDESLHTTDYLNPELPEAKVKEGLAGKYESMLKSYGKIDDLTAIDNIERDNPNDDQETYESKYTDTDLEAMDEMSRLSAMEEQLRQNALKGESMARGDEYLDREADIIARSRQSDSERLAEVEAELAKLRRESQEKILGDSHVSSAADSQGSVENNEKVISEISDDENAFEVVKRIRQSSDYFHTLSENDPQPSLIKAIIDEDIKAVDGSRVRLRLLDDIEIGNIIMPKGSYLYAIMNGFSSQRVKGTVKSLMYGDNLVKVSLSLYDTDGLEGLYIPGSQFRETSKEVASSALSSSMNMNQGGYNNNLSQWGMQAIQNAYQRTTSAVGKVIRKNSAKLKYGTFVYLVNGKENKLNDLRK